MMSKAVMSIREEGRVDDSVFEEIRKDVQKRGGRK
jgi:hypothetical protein